MTVRSESVDGAGGWDNFAPGLMRAYVDSYRGPQGDAPVIGERGLTAPAQIRAQQVVTPALLAAHGRLGFSRRQGTTNVATYGDDDRHGFGPALQLITDETPMLLESVTVLLNRLGVAYVAILSPVFRVRRRPDGVLEDIRPRRPSGDTSGGVDEAWIHVELAAGADRKALEEVEHQLPSVVADAQLVARDSAAMRDALHRLAGGLERDNSGQFPAAQRHDVAQLLRWLDDGHFVLVGYQRCSVSGGDANVHDSSRLGVLRRRQDVFPQLTGSHELFLLTQATVPSYLRYGAYPYVVVVRDNAGRDAIEHRLVGLFTVAAMNANVLEIPVISRRVVAALERSGRDPKSLPGQLLLDVIQTFPRSELFALDVDELLKMATAIIDVGSRRRTLLFMRADQLGHFRLGVGLSASRPLHHRCATAHDGHPGTRTRRHQHRLHGPSQRVTMGRGTFHDSVAGPGTTARGRHVAAEPAADPVAALRGGSHLGGSAARGRAVRLDRPGAGRALRRGLPRGLQAGRDTRRRDRAHRHHRRAAG